MKSCNSLLHRVSIDLLYGPPSHYIFFPGLFFIFFSYFCSFMVIWDWGPILVCWGWGFQLIVFGKNIYIYVYVTYIIFILVHS